MLHLLLASLLTLAELNCENLFDPWHDEGKEDIEYTPQGFRHWTRGRFWQKLSNLAQAIASCGPQEGDTRLPDLVALCEVENDSCLLYLTRRSLLKGAGYEFLMTESPDARGVDVALLYLPQAFRPICYDHLRVEPPQGERPTRDILYVKGQTLDLDTLHLFVCHMPSRYDESRLRRRYRQQVAAALAAAVDSLLRLNREARILVAGDFNEPCRGSGPAALRKIGLECVTDTCQGGHGAKATYRYQGQWENIDHVMLSDALRQRLHSARLNDAPFLLQTDEHFAGMKPKRTFQGARYQADGYSDHLPLVVTLRIGR